MEVYFFIGVIYALFNRDHNVGVYGFVHNTALWPIGILKNVFIGWSEAKYKDDFVTKANIKQCQDSMEEFHNILADTILEETGKGIAEQSEQVRIGMLLYEIQAALAAAKKFRLELQYHRDFAVTTLTRGGLPRDEALGMVDAVLQTSSNITEWSREAIDGAAGYKQFVLGMDSLSNHVRLTLKILQSMSFIKV